MYHNAVSYTHGLLDELDQSLRAGRDDVAALVLDELKPAREAVSTVDSSQLDDDGKATHARLLRRLDALDTERAAKDVKKSTGDGPARTTKATTAPEKAVPPKTEF